MYEGFVFFAELQEYTVDQKHELRNRLYDR